MDKELKNKTIGIIGGGQLGRMICFAAHQMGFKTVILTDKENSPASFVSNKTIVSDYDNDKALQEFASLVDFTTFEFENIPLGPVRFLEEKISVFPSSKVLQITQNRLLEKDFLNSIDIKTTNYAKITSFEELEVALEKFEKAILKTATMGYDGKGQFVLSNKEQALDAWQKTTGQKLILEKFCPFSSEISTIVARSKTGEIACYEPLTNVHKNGILDESIYPAKISQNLIIKAQEIAKKIAKELDLIGIMAIEFFVVGDNLLVNEMAPRPHNSGHFSMDAAVTSQFEQLIRAINSIPLGSTNFHSNGHMKNLIGEEVLDLEDFYKNPSAKIHLYGKQKVAAGRKMGHVNFLNLK